METAVMQRVKADFTALFRKWFILLVDDVGVSVSLSSTLAPIIEQNGFLVEYENLSGGEKTAAALAYRLALNQVVNELTGMHSRELIVLDEPTDGFSTSQVEKLREVFKELKLKKVILVSHESEVEGFADQVIRLEKNDHVS